MKVTAIEWADSTFNPWEGCQENGPGCDNCYAKKRNARFNGGIAVNWGPRAPRRRTSESNWKLPLKWNAKPFYECEGCGWRGEDDAQSSRLRICTHCGTRLTAARRRVFCASLADVFDNAVPVQWRISLMRLIAETPNLDWLLLTKRIGNAAEMLETAFRGHTAQREGWRDNVLPNVWIGATIVNQVEADRDIPKLLAVPAARRFLSMEPLLGPVDLTKLNYCRPDNSGLPFFDALEGQWHDDAFDTCVGAENLDWIIVGGESGPGARPMHPDWARALRDQCAAAGVPFLFKQWGEWAPIGRDEPSHCVAEGYVKPHPEASYTFEDEPAKGWAKGPNTLEAEGFARMHKIGKKSAGRLLDGIEHNGFPEDACAN